MSDKKNCFQSAKSAKSVKTARYPILGGGQGREVQGVVGVGGRGQGGIHRSRRTRRRSSRRTTTRRRTRTRTRINCIFNVRFRADPKHCRRGVL